MSRSGSLVEIAVADAGEQSARCRCGVRVQRRWVERTGVETLNVLNPCASLRARARPGTDWP